MIRFLCPICKKELFYTNSSLRCESNHSFDVAAEKYINLTCGKSGSGDSKDMCRARRDFLRKDYYKPFAELIAETAKEYFKYQIKLIDAGCGEGYYIRNVSCKYDNKAFDGFGIDLAKDSVRFAAKAQKHHEDICKSDDLEENRLCKDDLYCQSIKYAVCGIFDMPFKDNTFDCLLSIFAPVPEKEAARVLKDNGIMIVAHPGAKHLDGMKSALYESTYENDETAKNFKGFLHIEDRRSSYSTHIDRSDLMNLLMMTPYYWKTSKSDTEKYLSLDGIDTELDFIISIYKKSNN